MNQSAQLQLKTESIIDVPFESYYKDFTFLVNDEEFKTNKIIADILSPTISKLHLTDPTIDSFTIKTQQKGNFSNFLDLINFEQKDFTVPEALFISEIVEILGNKSVKINEPSDNEEIAIDNIFERISLHSKFSKFYLKSFKKDVDYISSHFFEICENQEEDLKKLSFSTLQCIFENPKLILSSEDQLVTFINKLYKISPDYSALFGYVNFSCISQKSITEFLNIFNVNDITQETWKKLSMRLKNESSSQIKSNAASPTKSIHTSPVRSNSTSPARSTPTSPMNNTERYVQKEVTIKKQEDKDFNGIINYLRNISNGNIFDKIAINASSVAESRRSPQNVIIYEDKNKDFSSKNEVNSWLSIDFKNYQVIPTEYTIQSFPQSSNGYAHPKSWVIEGSNDNKNWEIVNEQVNSSVLNGESIIHTFPIGKDRQKAFRYLRMRITGQNWGEIVTLCISAIEFYGTLIPNSK